MDFLVNNDAQQKIFNLRIKQSQIANTICDLFFGVIKMKIVNNIALILNIIGGINWGLIGLFKFDLVAWICGGQDSVFARIIYCIVGLAAIWCISLLFNGRTAERD